MTATVAPSFLNYTPVSLAFGTSGLRGLVTDITDLEAYINVKGGIAYLLETRDIAADSTVVVGGDLRPSSDRILRATARAIVDAGCQVENAGKLPTPALVLRSLQSKRAGVMVTGSHIPFDRNGIKINKSVGEILKSDEPGILRHVARIRAEEYACPAEQSAFDASGMLKSRIELGPVNSTAVEGYVARYRSTFTENGLAGLRVLLYQHSAVGRDILARILRELGADVVPAGRTETFVALDTENVTDEELGKLGAMVTAAEASGPPIAVIVSTDGDSDRPLVLAVAPPGSEKRVQFMPGDRLGIVVAEYLGADAVAVPVSANDAVRIRMRERGVTLRETSIGSPYVVAALDELRRAEKYARIVGWEANGGFLTGADLALSGGTLARLPTRDAVLPILANLFAAAAAKTDLATIWSRLPARFGRSGLLDNVPSDVSRALVARLVPAHAELAVDVEFDAAGNVTANGAPLPATAAQTWHVVRELLVRVFSPAVGFDNLTGLNVVDGIRARFANGDVAHVRPSGNAPQLRIYANSDTQARADQIVALGLREPDGLLRQLMNLVTAK